MPAMTAATRHCATWRDHVFDGGLVRTSGRHPTRGAYVTRTLRCTACGYELTETEWTSLPAVPLPAQRNSQEDR